ncbi:hypothetical protein JCM9279_000576 [Rhodotorula babjevae]
MAAAAQGPFKLKLTLGGGAQGPTATAAPAHPAAPAHAHQPPQAPAQPPSAYAPPPTSAPYPPHSTSSPQPHRQPPPPNPAHYAPQAAHYHPQHASPQYFQQPAPVADDHDDRVSANKYRKLKQLHLDAVASRDDAHLALYRAQKLIARLRDDKSSLLDRVVELELAAGITSADVVALRDQSLRSERELAFPLLHPPTLPSMADRARPHPVLTTTTDLANDQYNAPLGPAPLAKTLPPRQRSHHLRTAIAAQKLRDDYDAQRVAHGLPRPTFPAVAVLGLEGSSIALNVERAMSGVELVPAAEAAAAVRAGKRPRESSSGVSGAARPARGRARRSSFSQPAPATAAVAAAGADVPTYNHLPNPFAAVGAVPLGSAMARNNAEAIAAAGPSQPSASASAAAAAAAHEASVEPDSVMDDAASVGSGDGAEAFLDDDGGDYKPAMRRAGARKSDYGVGAGAGAAGDGKLFKPKKVKQHNLTTGTFSIAPIPRNADGSVRLPASVGIMQIKSLGRVDPRDGFHTERYIFPVGFEATRRYPSMVNRTGTADYVCRITDGGDGNARFELHPSDQPGVVISSGTPTGAWTQVVKATNKLRERNHSNSVSGPDYYGLSHNVVKAMIQELPGADAVPGYIWQHFVEDAAQARTAPGAAAGAKKTSAATSRRKSRGAAGGYDQMSPDASGEIAVDDAGGYSLDTGYGSDDYGGAQDGYAPGTAGDYQVQPNSSLQHLLASANAAPPANPYDIPTSMPASSSLGGGVGVGVGATGGAIDPMFNLAGAGSGAFDPYAVGGQAIIDPAFADASAYAYPMQPGGQPVEYPSSEAGSD